MVNAASLESSGLLYQAMHTLMEGVAIIDKRRRLIFANRALEQLLGYEPGELVGLPWTALFPGQPGRRAGSRGISHAAVATGRSETPLLRKDGTPVWVLARGCPLQDSNGDQTTLVTFADLRDHALQAPAQQLASQQMASIIHELSNSLTIVSLQAQLLAKRGPLTPSLAGSLNVIHEQTRRMKQMVDNLRATADPHQVQVQTTDVNALLEQTLELEAHALQVEGIEVITDLDATLPTAGADPNRLQQVFVNLINNAREAIAGSRGEGRLTITTRTLSGDEAGPPWIQVRFEDNGPGIPVDVMPHIFEPFFSTKLGKGMGLGLSICRQIVHKHGGRILADPAAGGGACLVVELPAADRLGLEVIPVLDSLPTDRSASVAAPMPQPVSTS